jgi:mono/diheme cytochrome c family protein
MRRRQPPGRAARAARSCLAAAALAGGFAAAPRADDASVKPEASSALIPLAELTDGPQIYGHICQGCHMPEAQGAIGAGHYPKLAGDPALVSWEYVALTVLNGKNGMPGFGQKPAGGPGPFASAYLTDAQVADVVNYVRSHFGNRYKPGVTARQVAALPHPGGTPEE